MWRSSPYWLEPTGACSSERKKEGIPHIMPAEAETLKVRPLEALRLKGNA